MMKITKEELKKLFEKNNYFLEDYILSKAYLGLYYLLNKQSFGQEVFSLCLDGPSGAGKTSFVEAYTKVASELLGEKIDFINYQLDAETGKSDLYEDVDVVATFENDTSKIRLPGTILKAINIVNQGHYVIVKMDEYDKARDSTDTFFNNFLQEGIVNTIQHGDVKINPENFGKLQVFLCKNDMRVDLSEPMMRRNKIIRLDYMEPSRMFSILQKFTDDNNLDGGLLNLVTLIYQEIYDHRDLYTKLPSCSECKQAIMDAYLLIQMGGFCKKDVYTNIIEDMLKIEDDVKSFESSIKKSKDKGLKKLIEEMQSDTQIDTTMDLKQIMAESIFVDQYNELKDKTQMMEDLITEYTKTFEEMEKKKKAEIDEEIKKIKLQNGQLVLTPSIPNLVRNFGDETCYVKRGYDIFGSANSEWTDMGEIYFSDLPHDALINNLIKYAADLDVKIYENGVLLKDDDDLKLIVINDIDNDGKSRYRFMSSQVVMPSTYLVDIKNFISFMGQVYDQVGKGKKTYSYSINWLVYNDDQLSLANDQNKIDCDSVDSDVYSVVIYGNDSCDVLETVSNIQCTDLDKVREAAKRIMDKGKQKTKHYES